MDFSKIGLFQLAGTRLDYLAQRQKLIAENVVNANTPDYTARDLKSFDAVLNGVRPVETARTAALHLTGGKPVTAFREAGKQDLWESTPSGNAVSLEQEMSKGSETRDAFALTTSLFQRNVQMLRMAWRNG
ncbi:flagellar biosynthesis protein FlgG [Azospirillum agricola]|uniref:flagellar biosynthesis protein FlgG n=1 Tax=Azospirillum agricola TaxID=1720247 RepID=UPI000A0F1495|nr:flagellar biosynthesis protein FlgG [Azospirillum agricola]MBP2232386.1 flagellar basal-body rod protein FlgB [Azospirillum agricola]SMH62977.1 flagellar basal-body rod protein FlgB [Azospirillum lipoferum]